MITSIDSTSRADIARSIETASLKTGAEFSYLMRTALRESGLDPAAKAPTSSATGLFQFIEQTWLGMLDRHGAKHGLGAYAQAIEKTASGRYVVADRALRQEILALRKDPDIAAVMAGELAGENRRALETGLGRPVTDGEVYAAHFLGPAGAVKLLRQVSRNPEARADRLFPEAAEANRSIFYARNGRALDAGEVYQKVTALPKLALPEPPAALAADGLRGRSEDVGAFDSPLARNGLTEAELAFDRAAPPPTGSQALLLTPEILSILAALDPLPERTDAV